MPPDSTILHGWINKNLNSWYEKCQKCWSWNVKRFFGTGDIQGVMWLTNILLVSVVASLIEWNVAAPDHVDEAHRHPVTVGQKVFVVLLPHAVADPRAMVVKTRHALVTHRAVLRPGKKQTWNFNNWNQDRIAWRYLLPYTTELLAPSDEPLTYSSCAILLKGQKRG